MPDNPAQPLMDHQPTREFFIGVDSDGCTFDTMELKQKECFIPQIIKHFHLQPVSKFLRECAEFVNLYSQWRGTNRFPALVKTFEFLAKRPEVKNRHAKVPELSYFRQWVGRESKLGNPGLERAVEEATGEEKEELLQVLEWSKDVNQVVSEIAHNMPPFPSVEASLEKASGQADLIVVSGTPEEALVREWAEHGLDQYVAVIAGQEMGKKNEHLQMAAGGKYPKNKVLMVGDAPGDLKAAKKVNALFYPILPGKEEASWQRFSSDAADRFFSGRYEGEYEEQLIHEFMECLPDTPPWERDSR